MRIAILGTGHMGTGLARGWARAGHQIIFGSRDPGRTDPVAAQIGHGTTATEHANAGRMGEVVVLAVPYQTMLTLVGKLREELRGKVVMDITNPMKSLVAEGVSGAQQTARAIVLLVLGLFLLVAGFIADAAGGAFYLLAFGVLLIMLGLSFGWQKLRRRQG